MAPYQDRPLTGRDADISIPKRLIPIAFESQMLFDCAFVCRRLLHPCAPVHVGLCNSQFRPLGARVSRKGPLEGLIVLLLFRVGGVLSPPGAFGGPGGGRSAPAPRTRFPYRRGSGAGWPRPCKALVVWERTGAGAGIMTETKPIGISPETGGWSWGQPSVTVASTLPAMDCKDASVSPEFTSLMDGMVVIWLRACCC